MKKFLKTYPINFYHVGADKRLTLLALMNMVQDIASDHAQALGFGHDQLDQHTHWVLVRQKIQMEFWPKWQDEITIETFISHADIGTPPRDIVIYFQDKIIGRGQTSWLVVDGQTRKIANQKVDLLLSSSINETCGVKTHKVSLPADLTYLKSFQVQYSDLDMNFHVNNAVYGRWVTDSLSLDLLKEWRVSEFSINYLQEILYPSEVNIRTKTIVLESEQQIYLEGRVEEEGKAAFAALVKLVKRV